MNKIKKYIYTLIVIAVIIILPFAVFTLITSKSAAIYGIRSYVILTGSMVPTIPVNAIVYSQPTTTYKVGDIIAFTRGNITVTHRIKQIEKKHNAIMYQTKGDANDATDIQLVSPSAIQGKAIFILPYLGNFILFLRTIPGFLIFVGAPVLLLIGFELMNIKKEMEKDMEKKIRQKMKSETAL